MGGTRREVDFMHKKLKSYILKVHLTIYLYSIYTHQLDLSHFYALTGIISKLCLCCSHCGVMIGTGHSRSHGNELSARMVKLHPTSTHGDGWVWPTYVVRQVGGAGGGDSPMR